VPPEPYHHKLENQAEKENLTGEEPEIAKYLEEKMRSFLKGLSPVS
jgi:hypothetical protein